MPRLRPALHNRLWTVEGDEEEFQIPATTLLAIIKRKKLKYSNKLMRKIQLGADYDAAPIFINKRDFVYSGSTPNDDPHLMIMRRELRETAEMRAQESDFFSDDDDDGQYNVDKMEYEEKSAPECVRYSYMPVQDVLEALDPKHPLIPPKPVMHNAATQTVDDDDEATPRKKPKL
ncbi:Oidioi.mRNA.OKI2018_I69.chr2.g7959.t1.cds [Oikopleura dioica]|uniref:Oidioi.mRNA.OKI2018_I69.chr2.g7959.t1.cds n=1 Tax=Oikopleura dioica TaxID=34765 RepID=A0ABN7TDL0_OIKDI|nr:Oidioi.mRNA.OKI2018_I69.chr2.g7959.t1.cds [Oikopleura dioica]